MSDDIDEKAKRVAEQVIHSLPDCPSFSEGDYEEAVDYIAAALRAERQAERERCAQIADKRAEPKDCDRSFYDASCNAWECSLEIRGQDCTCAVQMEEAEKVAAAIRDSEEKAKE